MKLFNLISTFALSTSLASAGSLLYNHEFTGTPTHHQLFQQNPDNWGDVNLNDFIVPSHYLTLNANNQANDPSLADVNYNLSSSSETKDITIQNLGAKLDNKYQKFEGLYNLKQLLFQTETANPNNLNTDFSILDQNATTASKVWNPHVGDITLGTWKSYNLTFENLLNHTSFNFSLNLFNFDQKNPNFTIKKDDAHLPSMYHSGIPTGFNHPVKVSSHITNSAADDITALDFAQALKDPITGNTIGQFNNAKAAGFFLKPLQYTFNFQTSQTWGNNHYNNHTFQSKTISIDLSQLRPTTSDQLFNGDDAPVSIDSNGYVAFDTDKMLATDYYHNSDMQSRTHFSHGQTLSTDDLVQYYTDWNAKTLLLDNESVAYGQGDSGGHGLYFNFATYGTKLSGSYNPAIFNNSAYTIPPNFNPAQTILNKILDTNIIYNSSLPRDIASPSAQNELKTKLNSNNNNVLTATDLADSTITLQSGSDNLVAGNNPAVLNLNFYGFKATKDMNIEWGDSPSQDTFNKIIFILTNSWTL